MIEDQCTEIVFPARACGMEAGSVSQHRTLVNPQVGFRPGPVCLPTRRPVSGGGQEVGRAGAAGSCSTLPQEISSGPVTVGHEKATTSGQCLGISRIAP